MDSGDADYILLLSVNPGFGGQGFIPNVLEKARALRGDRARRGLSTMIIEADGGINKNTIARFGAAGVDALVMGSAIFGAKDYPPRLREAPPR